MMLHAVTQKHIAMDYELREPNPAKLGWQVSEKTGTLYAHVIDEAAALTTRVTTRRAARSAMSKRATGNVVLFIVCYVS
jgi:hypothetical protein